MYLFGIKFKIFTDFSQAFNFTIKKRDLQPKVARWALTLEEFNCTTIHHRRRGSCMRHVDALSRYPAVMTVDSGLLEQVR